MVSLGARWVRAHAQAGEGAGGFDARGSEMCGCLRKLTLGANGNGTARAMRVTAAQIHGFARFGAVTGSPPTSFGKKTYYYYYYYLATRVASCYQ